MSLHLLFAEACAHTPKHVNRLSHTSGSLPAGFMAGPRPVKPMMLGKQCLTHLFLLRVVSPQALEEMAWHRGGHGS